MRNLIFLNLVLLLSTTISQFITGWSDFPEDNCFTCWRIRPTAFFCNLNNTMGMCCRNSQNYTCQDSVDLNYNCSKNLVSPFNIYLTCIQYPYAKCGLNNNNIVLDSNVSNVVVAANMSQNYKGSTAFCKYELAASANYIFKRSALLEILLIDLVGVDPYISQGSNISTAVPILNGSY